MITRKSIATLVVATACQLLRSAETDSRLWLDAEINGKHARLCFDSGASDFALFRPAAYRLGVKFTEAPISSDLPAGEVAAGVSEVCGLSLGGVAGKARFRIIDVPDYLHVDFDGVIGWHPVKDNILQIDAEQSRISFLKKVPNKASKWLQLRIDTNSDILELGVPSDGQKDRIICIDTGSTYGVALPPDQWKLWIAEHKAEPITLNAFFSPPEGFVVKEEAWGEQVSVGPIVLRETPVQEASATDIALSGNRYEGTLGIAALKRLEIIVDGLSGRAYLQPKTTPARPYPHNRAGAVFVPTTSSTDRLVARVANDSPAEKAGIMNGDILLKIDDQDVTKEQSDPLSRLFKPAGTRVKVTLNRDGRVFDTIIILKEILSTHKDHEKD